MMKYQQLFNEQLRNSVPDDLGLGNILQKVLHISKESIYRRLRNETAYTLEELAVLSKHFRISLDNLVMDQDTRLINMFCDPIFNESGVFSRYLDRINEHLHQLMITKGQLVTLASELPASQSFGIRELRNFKTYYWQKVILNRSRLKGIAYSDSFYLGDVNRSIDTMLSYYNRVSRIDIWSDETIDATIRQITYCDQSGLFGSKGDKERVIHALIEMLNDMEGKLEGVSADDNPIHQFYVSSIELSNNCMMFRYPDHREAFINFSTFNSFSSTNHAFCNEIEMLIQTTIGKSVNISGQSDIHRHRFFEGMRKKVMECI